MKGRKINQTSSVKIIHMQIITPMQLLYFAEIKKFIATPRGLWMDISRPQESVGKRPLCLNRSGAILGNQIFGTFGVLVADLQTKMRLLPEVTFLVLQLGTFPIWA